MASKILTVMIGNEEIRLSEVSYSNSKAVHVYSTVTVPTPEESVDDGVLKDLGEVAKAIRQAMDKFSIKTKTVIFTMASSKIASKEVVAPDLKKNKLDQFINTNVADYFPVNIDEYVISYSVLENTENESGKHIRLMVVISPVKMVESYYELADMLNFEVNAIDYVGNSTLQLIRLQIDAQPTIVIQMGKESTVVNILKNNVLQLQRTVPYGKMTMIQALTERSTMSEQEADEALGKSQLIKESFNEADYVTDSLKYLVNNISRIMDYYTARNQDSPIEKAYIITECSKVIGIEKLFSYELNIHVEKIEVLRGIMASSSTNITLPTLTLYLANLGCVLRPVNFIPKSAQEKVKKETSNKYYRLSVLISLGIGVILIVSSFINYKVAESDRDDLKDNIAEIEDINQVVKEYDMANGKLNDAKSFVTLTNGANDVLLDFIKNLEASIPSDVSIKTMSSSDGNVSFSCSCNSKVSVAQFIYNLSAIKNVSNVYVSSETEVKDEEGIVTINFSVVCNFAKISDAGTEAETTADAKEAE